MEPLYFGTYREDGHYVWTTSGQRVKFSSPEAQILYRNDGKLAPQKNRKEGAATLTHFPEYTILAFWDYTIDSRQGSNSMFLLPGNLTFVEALNAAKKYFYWKTFPAEIKQV